MDQSSAKLSFQFQDTIHQLVAPNLLNCMLLNHEPTLVFVFCVLCFPRRPSSVHIAGRSIPTRWPVLLWKLTRLIMIKGRRQPSVLRRDRSPQPRGDQFQSELCGQLPWDSTAIWSLNDNCSPTPERVCVVKNNGDHLIWLNYMQKNTCENAAVIITLWLDDEPASTEALRTH